MIILKYWCLIFGHNFVKLHPIFGGTKVKSKVKFGSLTLSYSNFQNVAKFQKEVQKQDSYKIFQLQWIVSIKLSYHFSPIYVS